MNLFEIPVHKITNTDLMGFEGSIDIINTFKVQDILPGLSTGSFMKEKPKNHLQGMIGRSKLFHNSTVIHH